MEALSTLRHLELDKVTLFVGTRSQSYGLVVITAVITLSPGYKRRLHV